MYVGGLRRLPNKGRIRSQILDAYTKENEFVMIRLGGDRLAVPSVRRRRNYACDAAGGQIGKSIAAPTVDALRTVY